MARDYKEGVKIIVARDLTASLGDSSISTGSIEIQPGKILISPKSASADALLDQIRGIHTIFNEIEGLNLASNNEKVEVTGNGVQNLVDLFYSTSEEMARHTADSDPDYNLYGTETGRQMLRIQTLLGGGPGSRSV